VVQAIKVLALTRAKANGMSRVGVMSVSRGVGRLRGTASGVHTLGAEPNACGSAAAL